MLSALIVVFAIWWSVAIVDLCDEKAEPNGSVACPCFVPCGSFRHCIARTQQGIPGSDRPMQKSANANCIREADRQKPLVDPKPALSSRYRASPQKIQKILSATEHEQVLSVAVYPAMYIANPVKH